MCNLRATGLPKTSFSSPINSQIAQSISYMLVEILLEISSLHDGTERVYIEVSRQITYIIAMMLALQLTETAPSASKQGKPVKSELLQGGISPSNCARAPCANLGRKARLSSCKLSERSLLDTFKIFNWHKMQYHEHFSKLSTYMASMPCRPAGTLQFLS